jgi:hypothetical protein
VPETVPIQYGDLFEFLEDYRASISQLQYSLPAAVRSRKGDDIALAVAVPILEEVITLYGRIGDGGIHIDPESGDGMSRLEGFYRFVGQVVESMLVSGRFQVTGQWAAGGAAGAVGAAAAAGETPSPDVPVGQALLSGDLNEKSLTSLLMELYRTKARGILEITSDAGKRVAYVDKGGIVQWASDPIVQEECLGVLLARAKKIDKGQLRKSLELMNSTGQQQGQCFIDMGVLTFPQLVVSLMTQVELITRGIMRSPAGTYAFHPLAKLSKSYVTPPMKAAAFLFSYYRKAFTNVSAQTLDDRVAGYMDRYTVLAKDVPIGDMKLKKKEAKFLSIIGARSYRFREIFTVSNLGRAVTLQALLTLIELEMLQFVEGEDLVQRLEGFEKSLKAKILSMDEASPFDILELHWTSLDHQVKEGYETRISEWKRFGRGTELPPELEAMRKKILDTLDVAYGAIGETGKRVLIRKRYYEEQQHEFSADLLFAQGEMLMVRGRWDDVIDCFSKASELRPREGRYKQMLNVARNKKAQS